MGLIGISGPNGVGKSKLIEAIGYALYGSKVIPSGDILSDVRSFAAAQGTIARVELQFEADGQLYEVVRTSGKGTLIRLSGCDDCLASGPREVTSQVIKLLHFSPDAFLATCVARQKEVAGLQALGPAERKKVVNRLIGVTAVDRAISLAEQVRTEKNSLWNQADNAAQGRLSNATEALEAQRAEQESASEHLCQMESAESAARRELGEAQTAVQTLRERVAKVQSINQQLEILNDFIDNLESAYAEAQINISRRQDVLLEQAQCESVLRDTQGAEEQCLRQEQLAQICGVLNDLKSANAELSYYCGVVEQLERIEQAIATDEEALINLQDRRVDCVTEQTKAEHKNTESQNDIDRHRQLHQSALDLGEEGECETCGQTFGTRLQGALSRYKQAERAAQNEKATASELLKGAQGRYQSVVSQIQRRRRILEGRRQESSKFLHARNEAARSLKSVESLEEELAEVSKNAPEGNFNWHIWEEAGKGCKARIEAEQQLEIFKRETDLNEEYHSTLKSLKGQLDKERARKADLESQLKKVPTLEASLENAQDELERIQDKHNSVQTATRAALRGITTAEAQLKRAEEELEKAHELQALADAAQQHYLIAERVDSLLRQVRDEILAEAKPRITDLLENWASSLLSPHFRSIELTEDYRILADLGSGPKHLEHFSGGEQTLMSVMLRVAIAVFCQERAGYETGFLVLDEVFGDQDSIRRIQLVEFLQEIKPHFHQILVVNHIEAVTDMLDSILEVVSTGHKTSQASFRN